MTILRSVSLSVRTAQSTVMSPISGCLIEEWEHHRYTGRDLDAIEAKG
jgi:hypothetical protein